MSYTYPFPRPSVTVDAIIIAKDNNLHKILLIERGKEPFKGYWAFPGGFINMDETLIEACKREILEEAGLVMKNPVRFGVYDAINRDPRGRIISVVFYEIVDKTYPVNAADDASNAQWFSLSHLPDLAFDHAEIINDFIREIRLPC